MFYSFYLSAYQRERKLKAKSTPARDEVTMPDDGGDKPVRFEKPKDTMNAQESKKIN